MKVYARKCAKSLQSYLTLCNTMDCSRPGSSVHGILQARTLEWVAIIFIVGLNKSRACLGIFNFLEEISSLSHSIVFLYFFALTIEEASLISSCYFFLGTLHSNGYIFLFLLCLPLLFSSQVFVRPPQTTILPFWISFSWG